MASDQSFVDFVCEQMTDAGGISYRKMFGEYAIYHYGKMVALVCDNQLYVKPTPGGQKMADDMETGSPYPNAKPHFLITEKLDDQQWLSALIMLTARELPEPKPKKTRVKN